MWAGLQASIFGWRRRYRLGEAGLPGRSDRTWSSPGSRPGGSASPRPCGPCPGGSTPPTSSSARSATPPTPSCAGVMPTLPTCLSTPASWSWPAPRWPAAWPPPSPISRSPAGSPTRSHATRWPASRLPASRSPGSATAVPSTASTSFPSTATGKSPHAWKRSPDKPPPVPHRGTHHHQPEITVTAT